MDDAPHRRWVKPPPPWKKARSAPEGCNIDLLSQGDFDGRLRFTPGTINSLDDHLMRNPEWRTINVSGSSSTSYNEEPMGTISSFDLTVWLRRLPNFYLRNVMCPLVLLNALVLGVTVFQIVIADIMPRTANPDEEPVIITYAVYSFTILVSVTLTSMLTTNLSFQDWKVK